ncbi:MAG: penicillin-binding transpeptidase domain-containing protein [Actinomycetota bacterium]|jgi:peptidoglycan glycosyltransferase|nr:penicillin-binding transpeptidase domain-containing protein [Actinomycetota bacterium]
MGRRIQWLGVGLMVCFALIVLQLVNIQVRQAPRLNATPKNPRNAAAHFDNLRGDILAANGQILAESVQAPKTSSTYEYVRYYPQGSLYSQVVGYTSPYRGTAGIEYEYNTKLVAHKQPAQSISQLLNPPAPSADDVTITIEPYLQTLARQELADVVSPDKDGGIVVLDVQTGAVLAMYSSPSFTPNTLSNPDIAKEKAASHADFTVPDHEGFFGGYPIATDAPEPPGSTFKIVTTTAVYNLKPSLANFTFPVNRCTTVVGRVQPICNDARTYTHANACGGTIAQMLPPSCDPGYAQLGLALGATTLFKQAELFGYNSVPPIDIPNVAPSHFPKPSDFASTDLGQAGLAISAFGQQDVKATVLQQAMVAAAVANGGSLMTPHVMASVHAANGSLVERYQPTVYKHSMTPSVAAQVNRLMQTVATTPTGTAYGIFPPSLKIAVKTGTAQTTLPTLLTNTQDWMIGFAPYTHPTIAIAVLVPYQPTTSAGATVAGPIMRTMMTAALHPPAGQ